MTYQDTLDYLYSALPMYQKQGKQAFKKNLTNIRLLCKALGNPQDKFKSIHIAGTNGKGSTTHMIGSVLIEAGYKVGMYTSPHYVDYRERIKVGNELISKSFVVRFIEQLQPTIQKIQPSFFEITVAMAFDYFARRKVDIAIIETGLGGRLDSTNIITPILSVITNIGLDHQAMLGNTLPQIAKEKAGIIKPGVTAVIGEYQPEVAYVFGERVLDVNANIVYAENNPFITRLNLKGYQEKNARTAMQALIEIRKLFKWSYTHFENGINQLYNNTHYIGRLMELQKQPAIIADSAHNENGIQALFKTVSINQYDTTHIVYGTSADKDLTKILPLLPGHANYYWCNAQLPRALNATNLNQMASNYNLNGMPYNSVYSAYSSAKQRLQQNDLLLIFGSIFIVGEVLENLVLSN